MNPLCNPPFDKPVVALLPAPGPVDARKVSLLKSRCQELKMQLRRSIARSPASSGSEFRNPKSK